MKTVACHTLGCKVNTYESEAMLQIFKKEGYQEVNFKDKADVYLINTCTVTNTGDSKSRQMIRKAIRRNKDAIVAVTGCYSQLASQEVAEIDGVDIIIGTQYRDKIVDLVKEYEETGKRIIRVENVMKLHKYEDLNITTFQHTRAFMKIQDGCNNFCTYCAIPYARGRNRSRTPESVLAQARTLVDQGYVEIVLTGIHTAAYGEDLDHYQFHDLLADLVKVDGLKRLRISSIETSQITDEIIDLIGHNPKVVEHLHVPLQSGCDTTLKRMNRKYTTEQYYDKLMKIRALLPDIAFTTDVIVGFPGESEEEFQNTYNFIKKMKYTQLHVFPYSPRRGTPAAKMKDQVPENIKHDRVHILMDLSNALQKEYATGFIGKTLDVLFETRDGEYLEGHAGNYLKVRVKSDQELNGEIVTVKIIDYQDCLLGEI